MEGSYEYSLKMVNALIWKGILLDLDLIHSKLGLLIPLLFTAGSGVELRHA